MDCIITFLDKVIKCLVYLKFFPMYVFLFLQQFEWLVGTQYKPLELSKSDWASIRKSPPWAIDSWGLGEHK